MSDLLSIVEIEIDSLASFPSMLGIASKELQTAASGSLKTSGFLMSCPVHIPGLPNEKGDFGAFKTELVVCDQPIIGDKQLLCTVKINYWHGDDPKEEPHNHPWKFPDDVCNYYLGVENVSFYSKIIRGGYTQRILYKDGSTTTEVLKEGDTNYVSVDSFHTVYDVLPGTVTLMVCGPRVDVGPPNESSRWGYLIDEEGSLEVVSMFHPRVVDETFIERFKALNPHKR